MEVMKEFFDTTDRSAGILGVALIEESLDRALKFHLHGHRHKGVFKQMFSMHGALGAFGAKIDLGLLIGMYSEQVQTELTTMCKIRNEFAHKMYVQSFEHALIIGKVKNLTLCHHRVKDMKSTDFSNAVCFAHDLDERMKIPREKFIVNVNMFRNMRSL
jgi:hypothetical protein